MTYWNREIPTSTTLTHNVRPTLSTERLCASRLEPTTSSPPSSSPDTCACASDEVRTIAPQYHKQDKHAHNIPSRPLSILSQLPSRPTATPSSTAVRAIAADIPTTPFVQLPSLTLLQVRGAKRDTYDPSHRVRKRRHGFLSRLRSKNGRNTLKRRKLRGRNTLSH